MEPEGPQKRRFLRQNSMERDPRPDREMDSRSEHAHASDGPSERFADVYGAERESARHAEERLEFLSCDPFERSGGERDETRTDESAR
jgi:hypothetical protein